MLRPAPAPLAGGPWPGMPGRVLVARQPGYGSKVTGIDCTWTGSPVFADTS
jgi:hypothetical protein